MRCSVVEESVEDGVAEGGITDDVVPVVDADLPREQRASAGVAVVEDLEEVVVSVPRALNGCPRTRNIPSLSSQQ